MERQKIGRLSREDVTRRLAELFRSRREVVAACLFGSAARGEEGRLSDLDVAVLLADGGREAHASAYGYEAELLTELIAILRRNDVDLVVLNEAPPLLAHRVLRDGVFIHVTDDRALAEFRLRTLQRYVDTEPLRRLQADALHLRVAEGRFGR